jgi:prepilin-type N-terminal cleavage/methylation domain-containing protein
MTLFKFFSKDKKGFTVVELMVTISIIGILSTVTYASFSQAQKKSRIAKRISDLKQMQVALEYYYAVNKVYPSTGGASKSQCTGWNSGVSTANDVITGLAPNYIASIPSDPKMDIATPHSCYIYMSNGAEYFIKAWNMIEMTQADYLSQPQLIDPAGDGGANPAIIDGSSISAWKVYSPGAVSW